ncbi:MAG: sugar ABC transporter permease [Devosia sp.]|nr:sugar ABC transporter permease [Devosia sp.]
MNLSETGSTTAAPAAGAGKTRKTAAARRIDPRHDPRTVAVLVLPFSVLYVAFYILPIAYAVWQSLFALERSGPMRPAVSVFVGLKNYASAILDPAFHRSLLNVLAYGLGPSALTVILGLVIALVIDARPNKKVAKLARAAVFSPFAVPAVVGAIIWGFLYTPDTSPLVDAARSIGWDLNPLAWSPIWTIGNIAMWTYMGFNALIFLSALAALDPSIFESARVDGASPLRIALHIKIPLMWPSIVLSIVFNLIGTLQLFTEPTALRTLSNEISSGWSPSMLAYAEAAANRYSVSATLSTLLAIVTAIVSFALLRLTVRKPRA